MAKRIVPMIGRVIESGKGRIKWEKQIKLEKIIISIICKTDGGEYHIIRRTKKSDMLNFEKSARIDGPDNYSEDVIYNKKFEGYSIESIFHLMEEKNSEYLKTKNDSK